MISLGYAHRIGTGEPETGTGAPPNPPSGRSGGQKPEVFRPAVLPEYPTIRDQMAMAALTGLLARGVAGFDPQEIAYQAGKYADAMMAARQKGGAE